MEEKGRGLGCPVLLLQIRSPLPGDDGDDHDGDVHDGLVPHWELAVGSPPGDFLLSFLGKWKKLRSENLSIFLSVLDQWLLLKSTFKSNGLAVIAMDVVIQIAIILAKSYLVNCPTRLSLYCPHPYLPSSR